MRKLLTRIKNRNTALNYGREVVAQWCGQELRGQGARPARVLDIGCGRHCTDLLNARAAAGGRPVELWGVEYYAPSAVQAAAKGVTVLRLDVEREPLPVADGAFDLVIANQVLEHAKEIFWTLGEVSRVLRPGGLLLAGVPNLAALHNRVLLLAGEQPSTIEPLGPHVRGFTAPAFRRLVEADGYFRTLEIRGANFYPFPPALARPLSRLLPTLAVTLFFRLRRTEKPGSFVQVLDSRFYETAYYKGKK
jgi:SAM-dependent methyltransferase